MLGSLEIQQNPYTRISTAHAGLCTTLSLKISFPLKNVNVSNSRLEGTNSWSCFGEPKGLSHPECSAFIFYMKKINIQNNVCVSANMKYTPLIHQTYELWSKSCKFICLPNVCHKGQHPKTKQLTWNWQLEINQGVNWKNLTWICPAFSFTILVFVLWSQSESCRGRWAAVSGTPYTLAKDLLMQ